MKPDKETKWLDYAAYVKNELGLSEWWVTIGRDKSLDEQGVLAQNALNNTRKACHINFSDHFFKLSPEEQRSTVTHELLHCHLWPINRVPELMTTHLKERTKWLLQTNIDDRVEWIVDAMAEAWSVKLDTPDAFWKKQAADSQMLSYSFKVNQAVQSMEPILGEPNAVKISWDAPVDPATSVFTTERPINRNGVDYPTAVKRD